MNLRNITLHQLRLFNSLGNNLSFTKTAEELHLSQPAVSIQIKRLEDNVGIPLVEHIGRKIFLTEAGNQLFDASGEILDRLTTLNQDITDMEEKIHGPLKVSAITTAKFFMPHLLGVFLRDYPTVEPRLTITNQSKVITRLEENLDDLVIMGRVPDDMNLNAQYFLDNPLVVVAPPTHTLSKQKNITLERIAEERFIARELGSGTRAASKRLLAQHGLEAKSYMELGSSEAVKQAVMAGLGISVLSMHNIRLELEAGLLVVLDVQHFPMIRKWYAVHIKDKKLSNTASHFLEFLLKDGARIWDDVQHAKLPKH